MFPFFTRALRVDARLKRTYLARMAPLVIILFCLFAVHAMSAYIGAAGLTLFRQIIGVNLWAVTLAGFAYFASAITEEKEEMTLGLLRMTGIGPLAILLGKSTTRLLTALMVLIAQLPLILLAVTLGGVSPQQVFAAYSGLLSYIVFLSALALFWSVVCRTTLRASLATALTLVAFFIGPFLLDTLVKYALPGTQSGALWGTCGYLLDGLARLMKEASPFGRVGEIMMTGFAGPTVSFQVLADLALGVFFFLLAWASFGLAARGLKSAAPTEGAPLRRTKRRRFLAAGRAWPQSLMWKDFYFIAGGLRATIIKFVAYAIIIAVMVLITWYSSGYMDLERVAWAAMALMAIGAFGELVFYAGSVFNVEMRERTLAATMMLPMSTAAIAYRKLAGCFLGLAPALTYLMIAALANVRAIAKLLLNIEPWIGLGFLLLSGLFFLHLTCYLSLLVKHGAFVLALLIVMFSSSCFAPLMFFPVPFANVIITAVMTVVLHYGIGRRMRKVAGAE